MGCAMSRVQGGRCEVCGGWDEVGCAKGGLQGGLGDSEMGLVLALEKEGV